MIGFKSENLIVGLFGESLPREGRLMHFLGIFTECLDVLEKVFVSPELIALLLTHHIDLLSQLAVLSLYLIVADQSLVEIVLQQLYFVLVLAHDGSRGPHLLDFLLFVLELLNKLLVLILQDHQTPTTVISLLPQPPQLGNLLN